MKLYNTMTRQKDNLNPLHDKEVKIYTCGLTVYSQPHIGNWVSYIYWDVLVRLLQAEGYKVNRVQNITDVGHLVSDDDSGEDKMEKGARTEGITAWDVAHKYIKIAEDEANRLGLLQPDKLVRATDYIQQQVDFVSRLEAKGYTYTIENEGVYFDTSKLNDYGKLARLDIQGLQEGARVSVGGKKNSTDFALWKFSPKDAKRDMEWESPWGIGFPGWHLECSVIAMETLGEQIDIHTGGIDHIPVHHTNEIAQTESITNKPFAQIWLHNNHIKVNGQKMSKSLGNIVTLKDIEKNGYDLDAFKLMILSKHYTTEGNFTWDNLESSANGLQNLREWADLQYQIMQSEKLQINYEQALAVFQDYLQDDLSTPEALAVVFGMKTRVDELGIDTPAIKNAVHRIENVLGITLSRGDISPKQKILLESRRTARQKKDWPTADNIRDELKDQGIGVNDKGEHQTWFRL